MRYLIRTILFLALFPIIAGCKWSNRNSAVSSEPGDDIAQQIQALEAQAAKITADQGILRDEMSSLLAGQTQNVQNYALANEPAKEGELALGASDKETTLAALHQEWNKLELKKQNIAVQLAELNLKQGKVTQGQLENAKAEAEAQQAQIKKDIDAIKKLERGQCYAVHQILSRTRTLSNEERLEGHRDAGGSTSVLTCVVLANTCGKNQYADCQPRKPDDSLKVEGWDYARGGGDIDLGGNANLIKDAEKFVKKKAPCLCQTVGQEY